MMTRKTSTASISKKIKRKSETITRMAWSSREDQAKYKWYIRASQASRQIESKESHSKACNRKGIRKTTLSFLSLTRKRKLANAWLKSTT